ncbi:radical SAM protein [Candidatus Woesearchaeota archaeon]|nr:radical SAM protein [Candidatus Woesearchaeota archaeon]
MALKLEAQFRFYPGAHINVYRAQDGQLIETAVFSGENYHKNLVSITSQIGCPVGCSFCFLKNYKTVRNVSPAEHLEQVRLAVDGSDVSWFDPDKPLKVSLTRTGEPLLNPDTIDGVVNIAETYSPSFQLASIMPNTKNSQKLLEYMMGYLHGYKESFQINVSMHTTNERKRKKMIPYKELMSFEEIAEFGAQWRQIVGKRKINLSFVLMEDCEVNIGKLREIFNPEHFAVRLALYLPSSEETAETHPPSVHERTKEEARIAREFGYDCIESVPGPVEFKWDTRPGSGLKMLR